MNAEQHEWYWKGYNDAKKYESFPIQRKPLSQAKLVKLKEAFYAGFDAYETPAAPYSDVDEKWEEYKKDHGITD